MGFIYFCEVCISPFFGFSIIMARIYIWKTMKGEKALEWVKKENSRTLKNLTSPTLFEEIKNFALNVYESDKKLIYGFLEKEHIYYLLRSRPRKNKI